MSRPAASPGAAPRVLQLVLLVGGLFVLGLLCGERAEAAESAGDKVPLSAVSGEVAPPATSVVPPVRDLVRTVTEDLTRDVTRDVTRTVEQTVSGVLTEVRKELPPPPAPPVTSPAPILPDLPGVPDRPDVTGRPALPAPGDTAPAPKPAAEEPGDHRDRTARTGEGSTGAYGPWGDPRGARPLAAGIGTGADGTASGAMDAVAAQPDARFGYGPVRQGPADDPAGVPGNRSSGDNNGPRCADAHAVSVEYGRIPVRLVPGAAVRVEADETRDRYGDVPVSPA
ncbi:hypothetical protein [Streptomyces sp. KAU_LT]|uniref:hypothetical protein n=1 Tax=Streptomyces sp. KAU_LT TaxID=3046669 RepID=UPI0024B64C34|nr:hypothetical protein [Streptomyces sp. KAU_LT]MDI9831681.1 hypothetical protein [Streptomyces sp. KAU_LT]